MNNNNNWYQGCKSTLQQVNKDKLSRQGPEIIKSKNLIFISNFQT